MAKARHKTDTASGKLKIGDNWNAITIIALSQNNPLKAIAEFVENSIDAKAQTISVIRGKEHGEQYLKIIDDGGGIPHNDDGVPDFKYVATHICDSLKKRLKKDGVSGLQGEFGIGLLSFWTVGERLSMSSVDSEGRIYRMDMQKNEPGYAISKSRALFSHPGVELVIKPLLPGIRKLSGEKIQAYLASELRDRIKRSGVKITIMDRQSRKTLEVQPRKYHGTLLHQLGTENSIYGDVAFELYLGSSAANNTVELFKLGTRVVADISTLEGFDDDVWSSGFLSGMIDAPFIQLTPGTRDGVVRDERYDAFVRVADRVTAELGAIVDEARQAAEEQASRSILKSVRKALREAFLALPPEEYAWLDVAVLGKQSPSAKQVGQRNILSDEAQSVESFEEEPMTATQEERQKEFFEHAGPLYSVVVSPRSAIIKASEHRMFRAIGRDKSRRTVDFGIEFSWSSDGGSLSSATGEFVEFLAPVEPGLITIEVVATQRLPERVLEVTGSAIVTVTDELLPKPEGSQGNDTRKGLPGYTYLRAPGELWRSRFDSTNNIVIVNNGHRDFIYASRKKTRKLRYILQLYAKELVLNNFPGYDGNELLERMVELSLYSEESLR